MLIPLNYMHVNSVMLQVTLHLMDENMIFVTNIIRINVAVKHYMCTNKSDLKVFQNIIIHYIDCVLFSL